MTHAESIKDIYNGLVQKYQFDQFTLTENQTPIHTRFFLSEKRRESATNKLDALANMAHDLGEPELAGFILNAAGELGTDGLFPTPM